MSNWNAKLKAAYTANSERIIVIIKLALRITR